MFQREAPANETQVSNCCSTVCVEPTSPIVNLCDVQHCEQICYENDCIPSSITDCASNPCV